MSEYFTIEVEFKDWPAVDKTVRLLLELYDLGSINRIVVNGTVIRPGTEKQSS